jgi:hypothetical protein
METLYTDLNHVIFQSILDENGFMDLVRFYDALNKPEKLKLYLFIQEYDIRKLYMKIYAECIIEMSDRLNFNILNQFTYDLHLDQIGFSPSYEYDIMSQYDLENGNIDLKIREIKDEIRRYEIRMIKKAFDSLSFKEFKKFTSIHFPNFIDPWIRQDNPEVNQFYYCLRKKFRYLEIKFGIDVKQVIR